MKRTKIYQTLLPRKWNFAKAPWRSIIKGNDWFDSKVRSKINSADSLSFWHSNGCGNLSLSKKYARLYAISSKQQSSIKDMWDQNLNNWSLYPSRQLNKRELDYWQTIIASLPQIAPNTGESKPTWPLKKRWFLLHSFSQESHLRWKKF